MSAPVTSPDAGALRQGGTIDVEQFSFWYGKTQALFDINLAIAPREVTALIGPSGCGKSTFLRSINRLNELIPGARRSTAVVLVGAARLSSASPILVAEPDAATSASTAFCLTLTSVVALSSSVVGAAPAADARAALKRSAASTVQCTRIFELVAIVAAKGECGAEQRSDLGA